jgi:hypothetical protein
VKGEFEFCIGRDDIGSSQYRAPDEGLCRRFSGADWQTKLVITLRSGETPDRRKLIAQKERMGKAGHQF